MKFIVRGSMDQDWKIDKIDTTKVAEAFAKELKEEQPKTYFLNGTWGSGKTEYLKEVENVSNNYFKFIYLELWKPKNKSSLAQNLFEAIYPKLYILKTFLYIAILIITSMASAFISAMTIIPRQLTSQEKIWLVIIACLITTLITYYQNNFFDMDRLLLWLDKRNLQSKKHPRILIVDDFDRLHKDVQNELYLFFNQLNGKTRIIFVGDFDKINKNEDNYLSKIIDRQIGLPVQLQSVNIANKIENKIRQELEKINDPNAKYTTYQNTRDFSFSDIKKLFINEKRTARNANQYLSYVQNQLIFRSKLDRVDLGQELFIIYLYLFHKSNYNKLQNGYKPEMNAQDNIQVNKSDIEQLMDQVLSSRELTIIKYLEKPDSYFIDDLATSHSIADLENILENKEKLKTIFYKENEENVAELKKYLYNKAGLNVIHEKDYLFMAEVAIEVVGSSEYEMPNSLIRFVLQKYASQLYNKRKTKINSKLSEQEKLKYKASADEYVISKFEKIFNKVQKEADHVVTNGKKLHIYRELVDLFNLKQFSYDDYAQKYFKQIIISSEKEKDFGRKPYDAETLLYVLNFNYVHINFSKFYTKVSPTIESQVKIIENLCDTEYIYFWNIYLMNPREFLPVVSDSNLLGVDQLCFSYKGEIYANHVLDRCRAISAKS